MRRLPNDKKNSCSDTDIKPPYVYTLSVTQEYQVYEVETTPTVQVTQFGDFSSINEAKDFLTNLLNSTNIQRSHDSELLVLNDEYIDKCIYTPSIDTRTPKTVVQAVRSIEGKVDWKLDI